MILCEALLDALTFWCAGYRNVTSSYGVEGFTDELLAAFQRHGIQRVLIAYDPDEAGDRAAEKLAKRLMAEGLDCYRCRFPKGLDANQYALDVQPAVKSLGLVIRQAEWLGNGQAPERGVVSQMAESAPVPVIEDPEVSSLVAGSALEAVEVTDALAAETLDDDAVDVSAAEASPSAPEPPAYRVPPSEPVVPVDGDAKELRLVLGDRRYTVRGLDKNLSYEQLKVWLKAQCGDHLHVDTVELYQAKQRAVWIKQTAVELGVSEEIVKGDLAKLLRALEAQQDALIRAKLAPKAAESTAPALTPAQQRDALALLQASDLIARIVSDFERAGLVGEPNNALVGYLAAVSRKLKQPLAVLIQSTSAAGESTLMDAVLNFMPEAERVQYSAMTGQSLFYLGEKDLQHKILAIAEEEGVRQAAYALKLLQSQGSQPWHPPEKIRSRVSW